MKEICFFKAVLLLSLSLPATPLAAVCGCFASSILPLTSSLHSYSHAYKPKPFDYKEDKSILIQSPIEWIN